jgi:mycothione reductase
VTPVAGQDTSFEGMEHYDLAVIGSGSGNSLVTKRMADWQVAIIEEGTFGGTCLNVGCIPTKMYVYAADLAQHVRESARYGVDATLDGVRWADIRDRVYGRIDPIAVRGREYRTEVASNCTLYEAHATFLDARTLEMSTGEVITADRVVIATGSRPVVPPIVLDSGVPYETSKTIMRLAELPGRIAILGGGYIATEFAHVFESFGSQVTVIARSSPLLRHLDHEIAGRFTALATQRWDVRLDATVTAVARDGDGVRLDLADGSTVEADVLLVATGRAPNSDRLGVGAAGVDVHPDGRVVVDRHQHTTADSVWALGDVCSPHQLKHVSNHEARVVAHNLTHPDDLVESDHRFVPAAVFTWPQLANVGLTEEEASATERPYVTAVTEYGGTAYGWAMEDTTGCCKLIADRETGQLLGAHVMGEQAASLIQPVVQAMSFGLGVKEMARGQYWIHPALTEVVENALLALDLP